MNSDQLYLKHILDAIEKIETYVSVGHKTFMSTSHWQDATIRQLEIIGEATKRVSPDLRLQKSQVPWRRIAGLRDVLIHNYMGVDLATVWGITQRDIPTFKEHIQLILKELENED